MVDWKSDAQRVKFAAAVKAVQAGDSNAAEEVLTAMEPMVRKVAKRYGNPRTFEFDNLLQVGRIGVYRAMLEYDPDHPKGASLPTFCCRWIKWAMLNEVRKSPGDLILDNAHPIGQSRDWENGILLSEGVIRDCHRTGPPEIDVLRERRQAALDRLRFTCSQATWDVVRRWLHGETYAEIAKDLGVSRARAQQRGKEGLVILGLYRRRKAKA